MLHLKSLLTRNLLTLLPAVPPLKLQDFLNLGKFFVNIAKHLRIEDLILPEIIWRLGWDPHLGEVIDLLISRLRLFSETALTGEEVVKAFDT